MSEATTANSCWDNQLEEIRRRANQRRFGQDVAGVEVTPDAREKNGGESAGPPRGNSAKSCAGNDVRRSEACAQNLVPRNALTANDFAGSDEQKSKKKTAAERGNRIGGSKLARFSKFNFVGGIGIVVQFAALFFLKTVLHVNYLAATALAVEIAVLHNFVWHEQFTWADRVMPIGTSRVGSGRLTRLLRFHLGNGAVSVLGNLALMKVMVGAGHMNYLAANAIAIVLCSIVNFLVSDRWVFEG
jgi:putative flippase GtrA